MATHSSILAWKIPWTEEPGGLQCKGLQRVGHDWAHMPVASNQRHKLALRLPGGSDRKQTACKGGDQGSTPRLGRSPEEGNTHSSILAWKIPWTEEPGRLQTVGSQGIGHNWALTLSLFCFHCSQKYIFSYSHQLFFRRVDLHEILVSAVQQSESVTHILISTLFFQTLCPYRSLQSTEQSSLCYIAGSYQLSTFYIVVCQFQICPCPSYSLVTISLLSATMTVLTLLFCK